jgi:hypothetical protein
MVALAAAVVPTWDRAPTTVAACRAASLQSLMLDLLVAPPLLP